MSRDGIVRILASLAAAVVVIFVLSAFGDDRIPTCDVNGEVILGSVVEVRMFVDGEQYASWMSGMCPREYEFVAGRLDVLMAPGGPF